MSAFVVENQVINTILTYLKDDRDGDWTRDELCKKHGYGMDQQGLDKFGRDMLMLNIDAVEQRYDDDNGGYEGVDEQYANYKFQVSRSLNSTRMQAYKSITCFLYQCAEGNVPETEFFKLIKEISHRWAHGIVSSLPGYDKATW